VPRIVVFDSGIGSLSVIKPIMKKMIAEVIYFADQANYPYGTKTIRRLDKIIRTTISRLEDIFYPDIIVVASNTPSLLLDIEKRNRIIGVLPPLKDATSKTQTGNIGILTTQSVVKSKALNNYIRTNVPKRIQVIKIDATQLVDLVESGKFITQKQYSKLIIKNTIADKLRNDVDVVTLSSTHLPFLLPMLEKSFPNVTFLDPANSVAERISKILKQKRTKRNQLQIFTSGDAKTFQKHLLKIGITNKVTSL
jgi:glutamate racemase